MKRILSLLIILISLVFMCSCDNTVDTSHKDENKTTTVLIYICGSNLESSKGSATNDITEMLEANIPSNATVVLTAGGTEKWQSYMFSSQLLDRCVISNHTLEHVERLDKSNMGDEKTLTDFLTWGITNYPADEYGLILWDHGGSIIDGVCNDAQYSYDSLSVRELENSLSSATQLSGQKFSFVGFDACLMSNYETVYELAPYTKSIIASAASEIEEGWNYKEVLSYIGKNNFPKLVCDSYKRYCATLGTEKFTLSAIDTTYINDFKTALDDFLDSIKDISVSRLVKVAGSVSYSEKKSNNSQANYMDIVGFAKALDNTELEEIASEMIYSVHGEKNTYPYGLTIYFPTQSTQQYESYCELAPDKEYLNFIDTIVTYTKENSIVIANGGQFSNGTLSVILTPESIDNVKYTSYRLYKIETGDEADTIIRLGDSAGTISSNNCTYKCNFAGKWFSLNGYLINSEIVAQTEKYTEYSSVVKVNDKLAELIFTEEEDRITINGYMYWDEDAELSSRFMLLEDEDKITIIDRDFTEYKDSLTDGESFIYNNSAAITKEDLPIGYYEFGIIFTDLEGRRYTSNVVVVYYDGTESNFIASAYIEDIVNDIFD